VQRILSVPFIAEFVFHSPQIDDRTTREIVDILIAHGDTALMISQKCQEDPSLRSSEKTHLWAYKHASKAASQLRGAIRHSTANTFWADHWRRGRVEFTGGLKKVDHTIAIIEVLEEIDLRAVESNLPLEYNGTPLSYFSVNDFLNVASQLRTTSELLAYLQARRSLPPSELRIIGAEQDLFNFYLVNDGSFTGCRSIAHAREAVASKATSLSYALSLKAEMDRNSFVLEHVADQLSGRHAQYADGLPDSLLARYEPLAERRGYLAMQGVLADMRLSERAELGRYFRQLIERRKAESADFLYGAARLDLPTDLVFVFGSSQALSHKEVLERIQGLALGAMPHFSRRRCLVIVDREGMSYDVCLSQNDKLEFSNSEVDVGAHLFGSLKFGVTPLTWLQR